MNKKVLLSFLITTLFLTVTISGENETSIQDYFFELDYQTNSREYSIDYWFYCVQYLKEIGIKLNLKPAEFHIFFGTITETYDCDLAFADLAGYEDLDLKEVFGENGSRNMFGINTKIPYGAENEEMLEEGDLIMDLEERQQHYYEWQQLIMDKILPMLPFFSPRSYVATWAT
ncbi:MAG: hypothetical protein ACTSSL_10255, partial [Candidatus Heimdallarchaeaceae archaeon]